MKSKMSVLAMIVAFSAFTGLSISAQRSTEYAYQNSNSGYGNRDTRNPNTTTYNNGYGTYNSSNNGRDYNRDARYQSRRAYAASAELQRLYRMEDALLKRIDADIALGDRREARRDQEKLEDIQRHIVKEEREYAVRNNRYDRRQSCDRDGDRRH